MDYSQLAFLIEFAYNEKGFVVLNHGAWYTREFPW